MNKSILLLISSLLFSLCLATTSSLEGKLSYEDKGCAPPEDKDAQTVDVELCQGRTAEMTDGTCCVVSFEGSAEYTGKSYCVATINKSENLKEVTSYIKKTQKLTATFQCPVNKYEVSFTDESCKNKGGIVNTRKDCKARTASTAGNVCCVLKEKGSDTFQCVSVEDNEDAKESYKALAEKATSSEYDLDCGSRFFKTSFAIISLVLFFL